MSKLSQKLTSNQTVLTAECLPPLGADGTAIRKLAGCFPPALDAVVVADNPEEVRASALACAAILAGEKVPTVLSMVTRDRNRIALESDVLGAAALGVEGLLCLSGEHQSLGTCPQAAGAYDIDSVQLTQAVKAMCDTGADLMGRKLNAKPQLTLGASAHPYLRPMELNLLRLKKKIQAGASFLLTQAIFDLAGFSEWMAAVTAAGLDKKAAIVASILPLTSVEQAKHLAQKKTYGPVPDEVIARLSKAADPAKEGVVLAAEMARKVKAVAGVRGVHILSGGCEAAVGAVLKDAGLA